MAYKLLKSQLTTDIKSKYETMLSFTPETSFSSKFNKIAPTPILFYYDDGNHIHLPYLFASSLLQIIPNINIPFSFKNIIFTGSLRDYQISVEQEAYEQLQKYGTSTLGLHPGFGKTILGASLASKLKLLTVILVHREILTTQWKKTFTDVTNSNVWIVGEKYPPVEYDVIICMDTRWQQISNDIRDNVGFLIIDEAHAFCTPSHVFCLLSFHPKFILVETGTLERDDNMHNMIYSICGSHGIYRQSTKPFNVMKIITNTKPIRKFNRMGNVDWISLVQNTLMDERRNDIILNIISKNLSRKILILTSLKDHATLLYDGMISRKVSCDFLCGTKKGYIDSNVLIGTTSKIGTGFDPATSCPTYQGTPFDLLLLVCSIKKYSMLVQNIGRVFRSDFPTVMHFVDDDDIYKGHWYKARKWYLARGGTITDHNIKNDEVPTTEQNCTIQQKNWAQSKALQMKINKLNNEKKPLVLKVV